MNITYKIEFFSDWHCGSGLAAGADVDALVVKDKNGLPFIPGKTIKGLIREAIEDIFQFKGKGTDELATAFGNSQDKNNLTDESDEKNLMKKGSMFFKNVTLTDADRDAIVANKTQEFLYRSIASTAIDDGGIAEEHSLRKIEAVVPCTLEGEIIEVPDGLFNDIQDAMHFIKRLGVNRNRGLGRCRFFDIKEEKEEQK
jgi:CRISPR/Cas system CSM-associated protein Csm3 (group 7 of RAMP superfamily)